MNADTKIVSRRTGVLAVHSLDRFVFSVPQLEEAENFYRAFGLDVRRRDGQLDLYTFGHPHCWATLVQCDGPKQLQFVRYGIFADDAPAMQERINASGLASKPHPLGTADGIWLTDPDGIATQIVVADKASPSAKTVLAPRPRVAPGQGASPKRSVVQKIRPRYLSHMLRFSPDVLRMTDFCKKVLGLRLSDSAGEGIAFIHTPHGSDHHLVAFAKSGAPGFHHSSWDVGSIHDVGLGAEQMRNAGYTKGWGVGRHVLGSNYFHYVRDPWGSYCEYSCDIDYVPHDLDWPAADHHPEDAFYVWGPAVPEDFVTNFEPEPLP